MARKVRQERYLLVDSRHTPLARAVLESAPSAEAWQIQILDDKIEDVMEHELVQMVGMGDMAQSLLGRILRRQEDRIIVEPIRKLGEDLRQNLRMPVAFDSFIYPLSTQRWAGRRPVRSHDLSCGGVAFFCNEPLAQSEEIEIVIPITQEPLVLRCQVLRPRPSNDPDRQLYATKFVDLCPGEESMVREAVFSVQLDENRNKSPRRMKR